MERAVGIMSCVPMERGVRATVVVLWLSKEGVVRLPGCRQRGRDTG